MRKTTTKRTERTGSKREGVGIIFGNSTTINTTNDFKTTFRKRGAEGATFKTRGSNYFTGSIGNDAKKRQIKTTPAGYGGSKVKET